MKDTAVVLNEERVDVYCLCYSLLFISCCLPMLILTDRVLDNRLLDSDHHELQPTHTNQWIHVYMYKVMQYHVNVLFTCSH